MKATLKKTKPAFDIEIYGINFGTFIQVDEWEGFKKLKNDKSEFLIIAENPVSFDNIFGELFSFEEKQVPIIQASTSIINAIEKLKKKNHKSQKPTNIHKRIKGYNKPIHSKMPKPPAMPPKK